MGQQILGTLITFVPLIAMFVIMYLILIVPQKKKEKKTREMLNALKVGDNIITIGGIMGKVVNIKDEEITIESGVEKAKIKVKRWGIREVEKLIEA